MDFFVLPARPALVVIGRRCPYRVISINEEQKRWFLSDVMRLVITNSSRLSLKLRLDMVLRYSTMPSVLVVTSCTTWRAVTYVDVVHYRYQISAAAARPALYRPTALNRGPSTVSFASNKTVSSCFAALRRLRSISQAVLLSLVTWLTSLIMTTWL